MSATGDGLSAEAREQLGFPPEPQVDVEAQLAELRASRAGRGVDGGGDVDGREALQAEAFDMAIQAASAHMSDCHRCAWDRARAALAAVGVPADQEAQK